MKCNRVGVQRLNDGKNDSIDEWLDSWAVEVDGRIFPKDAKRTPFKKKGIAPLFHCQRVVRADIFGQVYGFP
ncbi:hypothetical protein FRD01_16285 [Microvenator marinus]|uniref:Uncharacterized protein n=1 Tax=Microvenator marinus TaxID=2600177 RepID=A0A5B8XUF8_9DELT|nr:hypothetical protein [Microvenator marinus]QED28767.1 hypothetical protein FRD01_16285 [Microvenator marinus]